MRLRPRRRRQAARPAGLAPAHGVAQAAESIASVLGAEPQRRLANSSEQFEVIAEKASLRVVIENPGRLTAQMKLWDSRGLAHHCDGRVFLSPEAGAGHPCGCPPDMAERRARARHGQGPQPVTTLLFRLAGCPGVGSLRVRSSSWRFAETVEGIRAQLTAVGDPALCELAIRTVEFTTQNGRRVCYHKPVVKVLAGRPPPRRGRCLSARPVTPPDPSALSDPSGVRITASHPSPRRSARGRTLSPGRSSPYLPACPYLC
ncbi:recombination directionality factor [Streptomyces sp. NPDC002285]